MKVIELKYSSTNTYLIQADKGSILFDTGLAGTFNSFCREMGELNLKVQDIDYILISHFHPDHMGIAQLIANLGPKIIISDYQKDYVHSYDDVIMRDPHTEYIPIDDDKAIVADENTIADTLCKLGLSGTIYHTPGHSDDSISLFLEDGYLFVGDLNPLYELELHKGTQIGESWNMLLKLDPSVVYYGHARKAVLRGIDVHSQTKDEPIQSKDLYKLVEKIMKYIDKSYSMEKIHKKTKADISFIEDVNRMYLTHQNVGVQGILDRIEIKGK